MRRRRWRQMDVCLLCWSRAVLEGAQRVRVEFEGELYMSRLICDECAEVLDRRKEAMVTAMGRTLRIVKRDQVGRNRIRGDGTWSCKGVWS